MRTRRLGLSGLEVSELGLGTWGLSGGGYGPVEERVQDQVIDRARALGITLFETADCYADGAMESRLGRRLETATDAVVVTRIGTDLQHEPPARRFTPDHLQEALDRSRERLRRDPLDVVLLHNPSRRAVEAGEAMAFLRDQASSGKVKSWGVSAGDATVAQAALDAGAPVVSLAYNALHPGDVGAVRDEILGAETGLLAHSVLAYGLLAGRWTLDHRFDYTDHRSERWTSHEFELRLSQLAAFRPCISEALPTPRAVALRYVLDDVAVSSAILGPRSKLQLDQLVRDAGTAPPYLPGHHRTALEIRLRDLGVR